MKRFLLVGLAALALMMILTACGGGAPAANDSGGGGSASGAGPADAARTFFTALLTGEGDPASLLCSTIADAAREGIIQAGETIRTTFEQTGAELDLTGITFTVQNESGNNADVVIAGTIKASVSGVSTESEFPSTTYKMVNENGWKVCG